MLSCGDKMGTSGLVVLMTGLVIARIVVAMDTTLETRDMEFEDPCKAAGYMGDIAIPKEEYDNEKRLEYLRLKEIELLKQKYNFHISTNATFSVNSFSEDSDILIQNSDNTTLNTSRKNNIKSRRKQRRRNKHKNRSKLDNDLIERRKERRARRRKERRQQRLLQKEAQNSIYEKTHTPHEHLYTQDLHSTRDVHSNTQNVHSRNKRAATARKERLWDHGVIPYEIEANFSGAHKALFKQAMRHWEAHTCIVFVEKTPEDYNYIVFTERPCGCCSFVGKRGNGPQAISIGKNCDKLGIVIHELGHVVGFWHEHTRPDRDEHVEIIRKHILPGQEYNFNMLLPGEVDSLGETYDFGSIMHYARNTFSKGTYADTIRPRTTSTSAVLPEIGQREKLSPGDITQTMKLYKCKSCGGTLQESIGTLSSPRPETREQNQVEVHLTEPEVCQWRIAATHGEKIVLNVTELDLPETPGCEEDYLEIRDGHWVKSPLIGRYCGTKMPETLVSEGSRMWVEYRTYNRLPTAGFTANYEAVCGGEIIKSQGRLSSPNYPDYYKSNKECVWTITVPEGYSVALKFQSFEIENHNNCVYDYLEVRDGHEAESPIISRFCGYKIPEDIKSKSNKLYVKFVSDGSVQKAGFAATFIQEYDECASEDHGCEHTCVNTLGGYRCACNIGYELHSDGKKCEDACGGHIDSANGTLQSPSYPDNYPPNKNCIWQIEAPLQYRITINFTHFDLEGNNHDCEYDSVVIRSGGKDTLHGTYCGTPLPQSITSESNILLITFSTDNTVQKSGFSAKFFTDKDECAIDNGGCQHLCKNTVGSYKCACHNGFTLHENNHDCKEGGCQHEISTPYGEIESPNWPDYYPSRKDCVWHLTTTDGHRVKLIFADFELEHHPDCTYDHIKIYDGHDSKARLLGKFCGSKMPAPLEATGPSMYITFYSDASVQRKGFRATHVSVCGGRLQATAQAQSLYSHAKYGDQNYESKEDCDWLITATGDFVVRLRFIAFQLEEDTDCGYDYVEVYDGKDTSAPLLGRFCSTTIPPEFISTGRHLLVRFKTDDTSNWKGFSAAFVLATPGSRPIYPAITAAPSYKTKDEDLINTDT